jgi:hypothetical protein
MLNPVTLEIIFECPRTVENVSSGFFGWLTDTHSTYLKDSRMSSGMADRKPHSASMLRAEGWKLSVSLIPPPMQRVQTCSRPQ